MDDIQIVILALDYACQQGSDPMKLRELLKLRTMLSNDEHITKVNDKIVELADIYLEETDFNKLIKGLI